MESKQPDINQLVHINTRAGLTALKKLVLTSIILFSDEKGEWIRDGHKDAAKSIGMKYSSFMNTINDLVDLDLITVRRRSLRSSYGRSNMYRINKKISTLK